VVGAQGSGMGAQKWRDGEGTREIRHGGVIVSEGNILLLVPKVCGELGGHNRRVCWWRNVTGGMSEC
jgi:hypothetical protein